MAVRDLLPAVLRPDLLPGPPAMALTEWDAVPGGIGLTAQLGSAYFGGRSPSMVEAFGEALSSAARGFGGKEANMVIAVSEESGTYRPEMEWLASELGKRGFSIGVAEPGSLRSGGWRLHGKASRSSLVYRFWELFDWENALMSRHEGLGSSCGGGETGGHPTHEALQEEKLSLALFGTTACRPSGRKISTGTNLNCYEA